MKRLSPSMVVAMLALLVALSTSAFAASRLLPRNSVGSAQIINHSVKKVDLHAPLPRGPRGPEGPEGPQGVFSTTNVTLVNGPTATVAPGAVGASQANCPTGSVALASGWDGESAPPVDATVADDDKVGVSSWNIVMVNWASVSMTFHAQVICAIAGARAPESLKPGKPSKEALAASARQLAIARAALRHGRALHHATRRAQGWHRLRYAH
jgi:hypothetical protein